VDCSGVTTLRKKNCLPNNSEECSRKFYLSRDFALTEQKQNSFTIENYENASSGHLVATCGRIKEHEDFSKLFAST
jgi:hypothetical protein